MKKAMQRRGRKGPEVAATEANKLEVGSRRQIKEGWRPEDELEGTVVEAD